ncbi:MAG: phospholipid-binding lipoprotein MlaA [Paraglaciecola sp.]|jgi:phospholipid-binding lipoprotein MlaA
MPLQSYKLFSSVPGQLLMVCCLILLSACSANKTESDVASKPGPELIVNSSHGTQSIAPTVVSYAAADTPSAINKGVTPTFDDPLELINRPIFAFNDKLFEYVLIPVSKGYTAMVPDPVRQGVTNFFSNIREPLNALNQLFQGQARTSVKSAGRFLINSTVGILGFFDPATAWFDIEEEVSTINDTLASYDVGYGSYLVLPLLGQSDLRNSFSTITESMISPIQYITDDPQTLYIQIYGGLHQFAPQAPIYQKLRAETEDPYVFFRNLYMQGVLRDQQYPGDTQQQNELDSSEPSVQNNPPPKPSK